MNAEILMKNLNVPDGTIDMVLDTDAYNEIDDQFAIAYMLRSEDKLNIKGIFAAPFFNQHSASPEDGMVKSYHEIIKILKLAEREDLITDVYRGSTKYLDDEKTPVYSEAAEKLTALASEYSPQNPLYVVAIGAITNVASAILMKPDIVNQIVVVWLGGHSHEYCDNAEFNVRQDVAAARTVFLSGAPIVQLPCRGVVSGFSTTKAELQYWLLGKNALCDYLVEHTIEEAESYAAGKPWSRVIFDVTAVAWLLNDHDRFMLSRIQNMRLPEYDNTYADDAIEIPMRYVYFIQRDALFEDLFLKLSK